MMTEAKVNARASKHKTWPTPGETLTGESGKSEPTLPMRRGIFAPALQEAVNDLSSPDRVDIISLDYSQRRMFNDEDEAANSERFSVAISFGPYLDDHEPLLYSPPKLESSRSSSSLENGGPSESLGGAFLDEESAADSSQFKKKSYGRFLHDESEPLASF